MSKRLFKQIFIASIFLAILVLVILGIYLLFFRKPEPLPENGDGQVEIKELEVLEVAGVQVKEGHYDLVAKIKNPNQNHGGFRVVYQFKLYDAARKEVLATREGQTFITPITEKYIVETKVVSDKPVGFFELIIQEVKWKKFKDFFQPELFVYDKKFQLMEEPGVYAQASGILKNGSPFDLQEITLNVVLKNKERKIVGVNSHKLFTLSSGEERYFATRWFSPIDDEVAFFEIEPEFNVFIDDNFIRRYGILEKFQEF